MADAFLWRGGSGAFGTAANWNDQTTDTDPALTPPGAADTAEFTSGGGTIAGTGTVAQLQFLGTVAWVVNDDAQLTDTTSFLDTSPLTIQNGSTIVSSGGADTIDSGNTAATAALLVTGAGSDFAATGTTTYLSVGTDGNGSLSVTDGAAASAAYLVDLGGATGTSFIAVDATSSFEIGTAGDATAGAVTIDAEANGISPQILGYGTVAAAVVNNGYLSPLANASGLPLVVTGAITGTGEISLANGYSPGPGTIVPGAVARLDEAVGSGQQVAFSNYQPALDETPTLILADPIAFSGTLVDFDNAGDTLELPGETVTGASVNGTTLTVTLGAGGPLTFNLADGVPTTSQLTVSGSDVRILPIREFDWTGAADHNFSNASNWNDTADDLNPAAAPPTTTDFASITNAGSITGTGTVYQLGFTGTNTITGALTALAALTETSGSLAVTGTLNAASASITGTLTAKSGGRIASTGSVTLVPNAVIAVDGGSSVEIGAAGAPATGSISIDAAGGQVNGDGTLAGPVINNGTIDANFASAGSNTLEITGALTGDGEIVISNGFNISPDVYEPGAVLRLDAPVANTQSIIFGTNFDPAAAATLILADPSAFAGTLYDLNGSGSAIDLPGETLTGASVNGSTLTVTVASGGPFTFNLGYGTPTTGQLVVSGSELHVLPDRSFVWTGATSDDVSVAGNWNDTTDAANPAATAPTATDLVLITNAGLITGTGTAYQTNFYGTNTVAGTLSAVDYMASNTGSLAVTGSLRAATLLVYVNATLSAVSGGRVTTPGPVSLYAGAEISVDSTSSMEVGTAGTATAGGLTVDASGGEIDGAGTLAAAVVNNGVINAYSGTIDANVLEITGSVTGSGTLNIDHGYFSGPDSVVPGGVLRLDAGVGSAETVEFDFASDPREAPTLQLGVPSAFSGILNDFDTAGDSLQLTGESVTGASVNGTTMTVTLAAGGPLTFNLGGLTPQSNQLLATGSEVRVVPVRELDWTGASSNVFSTAGNWNDITEGLNPSASAPGIADLASIANAGSITGNGTAYQLVFAGTNTIAGSLAAVNSLTENSGSSTVTGSLTAAGISLSGTLAAKAGGHIDSSGPVTLVPAALLAVDGTSLMEVGTAGTATAGSLTVDAAGTVQVSGDGTLSAALINNGQIAAVYGASGSNELEITGAVSGSGTLDAEGGYIPSPGVIVPGAILRLDGAVAAAQQVAFSSSPGPATAPEVILADPAAFSGTIDNFTAAGDTLDLVGDTVEGASVTGTIMTVTLASASPLTLDLGISEPQTDQLQASGSTIRVVPLRDMTWTGASNNGFANALNWNDTSDGINPAASAPSASDLVSITNAGSITGNGTAWQMEFAGGNTITGSLTAVNSLTESAGSLTVTGTLTVAGATLSGTVAAASGGQFVSTGVVQISAGADLAVDATSFMEVGTASDATSGHLTVDASSGVLLSGDGTLSAAVINNSQIDANSAVAGSNTLEVTGAVTGAGGFGIAGGSNPSPSVYVPGGDLRFDASVASTETVAFNTTAAAPEAPTVTLADPTGFLGTISNFTSPGDAVDLPGETVTGATIVGSTMTVSVSNGGPLTFAVSNTPSTTPLSYSGSNVEVTPCFLAGTAILTERGEIAVENLTIGDRPITLSGIARPIRWIGFGRTLVTPRNRCDVSPVIVRRGALGDNAPYRDLHVTRRHAMLVGAVLVPVEHLINGVSVLWNDAERVVEYYHVELDAHDVMLANGAPAESFRDDGSRALFQNAASRPSAAEPGPPCWPVVNHGPLLERAWREVASRAGQPPADWLTGDPDPHMVVDGRRIEPVNAADGVLRFRVERPVREVRIVSRSCIPDAHGLGPDLRRLGIGVAGLTLFYPAGRRVVPLWTDELSAGFHEPEGDIRWTKGIATLPIRWFHSGRVDVELRIAGTLRYPREVA